MHYQVGHVSLEFQLSRAEIESCVGSGVNIFLNIRHTPEMISDKGK